VTNPHISTEVLDSTLRSLDDAGPATDGLEGALDAVVRGCAEVFSVDGCGLLVLDEDRALRSVAASDAASAALEAAQEELGEGPCVTTVVEDELTQTADVVTDERWPRLAERVRDQPVRAILGVPVRHGGAAFGALNVFRFNRFDWDDSDLRSIGAFAQLVERTVMLAVLQERDGALVTQLQRALDSRVVIERAVGHLMATDHVDAVAAFNLLRRRARDARQPISEVAARILG
jgi:GAF domain-containing protein